MRDIMLPALTADLKADGWRDVGGPGWIYWLHSAPSIAVDVEAMRRNQCDSPAFPSEPADPAAPGYLVCCRPLNELGEPYGGRSVWIESYDDALKLARKTRIEILAGDAPLFPHSGGAS